MVKLHTLIILIAVVSLIYVSVSDYVINVKRLDEKVRIYRTDFNAKRFIAESFRETCVGRGFKNLEEWQSCCKELFDLEYIEWADNSENLMYGKWTGSEKFIDCSGEVFCKTITRSANDECL